MLPGGLAWRLSPRIGCFSALVAGLLIAGVAAVPGRALSAQEKPEAEDDEAEPPESASKAPKGPEAKGGSGTAGAKSDASKKPTIDEEYVRANLEGAYHPSSIQFQAGGVVRLSFSFEEKKEEHESIFTPRVSKRINDKFRWTVRDEEYYGLGSFYTSRSSEYTKGLRVSNNGAAHLNLWFVDDVEVEVYYVAGITSSKKQTAAVVFTNTAQKSLGCDHGTQCVTFLKGQLQRGWKGTHEPMPIYTLGKFKLVVKNGKFEAWKDGKKRESHDYKPKDFSSGKVGMVWNDVGGFVNRIEITGKLDWKKVAADLRKTKK